MSKSHHTEGRQPAERPLDPPTITRITHAFAWLDGQIRAQREASARTTDDQEAIRWHSRAEGMAVATEILRNLIEKDPTK